MECSYCKKQNKEKCDTCRYFDEINFARRRHAPTQNTDRLFPMVFHHF